MSAESYWIERHTLASGRAKQAEQDRDLAREQRDGWMARAERAEAAEADLRRALVLIATGCSNVTRGRCSDEFHGRSPNAEYTADRWCDACVAQAGLDGDPRLAALDALRIPDSALDGGQPDTCICGTPGTGNFEGPLRDCPAHGEECPHLADVLAGRVGGPHDDSACGWCADIRRRGQPDTPAPTEATP